MRKKKVIKKTKEYSVKEYPFVLSYDSEDRVFIARAVNLKGCHSDGATPEEAIAHIYEAMKGWIETAKQNRLRIPPPSRLVGQAKKFLLRIEPRNAVKLEMLTAAKNASVNQLINEAIAAM